MALVRSGRVRVRGERSVRPPIAARVHQMQGGTAPEDSQKSATSEGCVGRGERRSHTENEDVGGEGRGVYRETHRSQQRVATTLGACAEHEAQSSHAL